MQYPIYYTPWDPILMMTLVDGWRELGNHEVTFDGSGPGIGANICYPQAGGCTASDETALLKKLSHLKGD